MTTHAEAITRLRDGWTRQEFTDREIMLYGERLGRFPAPAVMQAVNDLLDTCTFRPSIGEIIDRVAERSLNLPTVEEAWEIAERGSLKNSPEPVRRAAEYVGGRWAILHSDNIETVRAQFRQAYTGYRQTALSDFATGHDGDRSALTMQHELAPTVRALPESERAFAPPVDARAIRRMLGRELGPPTEAEKQHAIEILEEGPPTEGDPSFVYLEAERIFAEAGE